MIVLREGVQVRPTEKDGKHLLSCNGEKQIQ